MAQASFEPGTSRSRVLRFAPTLSRCATLAGPVRVANKQARTVPNSVLVVMKKDGISILKIEIIFIHKFTKKTRYIVKIRTNSLNIFPEYSEVQASYAKVFANRRRYLHKNCEI